MKSTYHKIRGIDKNVCTQEQVIAYNLCFRNSVGLYSVPQEQQEEELLRMINWSVSNLFTGKETFNLDSAWSIAKKNYKKYLKANCPVFGDYKDLGKFFEI